MRVGMLLVAAIGVALTAVAPCACSGFAGEDSVSNADGGAATDSAILDASSLADTVDLTDASDAQPPGPFCTGSSLFCTDFESLDGGADGGWEWPLNVQGDVGPTNDPGVAYAGTSAVLRSNGAADPAILSLPLATSAPKRLEFLVRMTPSAFANGLNNIVFVKATPAIGYPATAGLYATTNGAAVVRFNGDFGPTTQNIFVADKWYRITLETRAAEAPPAVTFFVAPLDGSAPSRQVPSAHWRTRRAHVRAVRPGRGCAGSAARPGRFPHPPCRPRLARR